MFTGIVQGTRPVTAVEEIEGGRRLRVQLDHLSGGLKRGASVAVNGTCLTATEIQDGWGEFDVIAETLRCTNLGALWVGDLVNIERSARVGDEIGGHHVSGHIDGTGILREVRDSPNNREIVVEHDRKWQSFRIPKGWIAIDGASLTIVKVGEDWFSVALIPETLSQTILGTAKVRDAVNLEFDHTVKIIVQTVEALFSTKPSFPIRLATSARNAAPTSPPGLR
ncbi:MAG: riboflavin synthase [Deltaproteobacteria bacterium]|jgi:riboflavin synthase|nr:riboflavin synthase [Deltaproteobacteria bacterium]MDP7318760.1 riboflavin synthase subunit alpha [SAR324 cluster bacterium]